MHARRDVTVASFSDCGKSYEAYNLVVAQVRRDQEIPPCVEVYIGLTSKSSGSRPQGVSSQSLDPA